MLLNAGTNFSTFADFYVFFPQYSRQSGQQGSMSGWPDLAVRRAIGPVRRGGQVRRPLCRSIKVIWNAVHWSIQVQVPDFLSLDGIYWITLGAQ